ncbi:MAG: amidohydrolase family protein [Myxococcaceae bacterium]|jgi:imidazolonepropionase-like amidohydrolase|nr:amidohydrolase family protein [Myxococcaceae bacterium]MCA3014562.1 amidohydrolase family protein [Myxococcaceae bacterium]
MLQLLVFALLGAPLPVKAIVGATVVDPTGLRIPDAVVLLRGERIEAVGQRTRIRIPKGAERIDASGKFLIPGLIDAHVHFFQSGGLYTRPDGWDLRSVKPYAEEQRELREALDLTFARYLRSGVTAVADMGGPMWNFEVRDRAARSERTPRVAVTGPLISSISDEPLDLGDPPIIRCATAEEAVALVRKQAERRPNYIKLWYVLTPTETVEKNRPMVRAAIAESHRLGLRVAVHATELSTARAALEEGADILVHSVEDQEVDDAFLELARARAVTYIPTLIVGAGYQRTATQQFDFLPEEFAWGDPYVMGTLFDPRHLSGPGAAEVLRKAAESPKPLARELILERNLLAVQRAGITVALGTDAGNTGTLHGPSVFRELALMEASGLTPMEVLKAATIGGARVMGRDDLGRIAAGAVADLLLLDADPATGTAALRRIAAVIRGGRISDPASFAPDGPSELAQRQLNAFNARALEPFLASYADDVEVLTPDGAVQLSGKPALREHTRAIFANSPSLHARLAKRIAVGAFVVDELVVTGLVLEPGAGERGADTSEPVHTAAVYEVRAGRIVAVRMLR